MNSWIKKNWKQVLLVIILVLGVGYFFEVKESKKHQTDSEEVKNEIVDNNKFQYGGEDGKDALTLLKEKTTVDQDKTGMVVAINGRKADSEKREFWSFYVNGAQANVGSADYTTKSSDIIDWKIENY